MIYYIKQEWMSFGNSFTILDEFKEPAFLVERELFTWGSRFSFKSESGKELAYIRQETMMFPTYSITKNGAMFATIKKEFSWFKQTFTLDVPGPNDYEIDGSFWLFEFVFRRQGQEVAHVSREHFSIPQHYGVSIQKDEDVVSILATCIVIDRVLKDSSG